MGPLSLYLGHIHAYDCIQYIVYNCWDLFQASFTGVRESWRTSDGSSHHVNCKNPSWSRYCIFARFLFLLLTYFFFFRQLVSLKMLNTLPQVSISVTLYWFSLMNKHIWRRKNNWNRYKRTPRRFVRRFDPLFLPEEQKWKRISNSYGFISWEISILEFSEIERRRLIPELLSQCLETKYIYLWIFIVMHKYLGTVCIYWIVTHYLYFLH